MSAHGALVPPSVFLQHSQRGDDIVEVSLLDCNQRHFPQHSHKLVGVVPTTPLMFRTGYAPLLARVVLDHGQVAERFSRQRRLA